MSKTNYLQAVISDFPAPQRRSTEELNALSGGPACVAYD